MKRKSEKSILFNLVFMLLPFISFAQEYLKIVLYQKIAKKYLLFTLIKQHYMIPMQYQSLMVSCEKILVGVKEYMILS